MFPRNLVHSAYRIMHGSRRQIMHYQFTFLTTSCLNVGLVMLRCDVNTFASAPICGTGTCLPVVLFLVCDARLTSITNIHSYLQYRLISFSSLLILYTVYERTYLSCRTSLSSLSYLPRKIIEVGRT